MASIDELLERRTAILAQGLSRRQVKLDTDMFNVGGGAMGSLPDVTNGSRTNIRLITDRSLEFVLRRCL